MTLPVDGYVQQVEIVVGGTLPRAGFVQPVEISGGGGFITGGGAAGQVTFWSGATAVTGSASFLYDDTNKVVTVTGTVAKQLRLAYDVANYTDFTVGATGNLTIGAVGDTIISGNLRLPITGGQGVLFVDSAPATVQVDANFLWNSVSNILTVDGSLSLGPSAAATGTIRLADGFTVKWISGITDFTALSNSGNTLLIGNDSRAMRLKVGPAETFDVRFNNVSTYTLENSILAPTAAVTGTIDLGITTRAWRSLGISGYIESTDGSASGVSGAATGRIRYNNATARWEQSVQGGAYAAFGGSGTVTASGPPVAGQVAVWTSATDITGSTGLIFSTANNSLGVGPSVSVGAAETLSVIATETIASGASATWNGINFQASTATLSGSTNITAAAGFNYFSVGIPTVTSGSAVTITNAATLSVEGPPVGSGSTTITNAFAARFTHNNATTHPQIVCLQNSTGDAAIRWAVGTTTSWIAGIDNSTASDSWVLSSASSGTAALGTNNSISIVPGAGVITLTANSGSYAFGANVQFTTASISTGASYKLIGGGFSRGGAIQEINDGWFNTTGTADLDVAIGGQTLAAERTWLFDQRTYTAGAGTTTITVAATVAIVGSPTASTGITQTSSLALWVQASGTGTFNTYFGATPSLGGGIGVIGIANAGTNPGTNPTGGGILYANGGAGTWRGSGGTVTAFGPAGPHCSECGKDEWTVATLNTVWKSWRFECGNCGAIYAGGPKDVRDMLSSDHRREFIRKDMDFSAISRLMNVA